METLTQTWIAVAALAFLALLLGGIVLFQVVTLQLGFTGPLRVQLVEVPPLAGEDAPTRRIGQHYDQGVAEDQAGDDYQDGEAGFTPDEFPIADAVPLDQRALVFPPCVQAEGYPWVRYAYVQPVAAPALEQMAIGGGINVLAAFPEAGGMVILGSEPYAVRVSAYRLDCRLFEGKTLEVYR